MSGNQVSIFTVGTATSVRNVKVFLILQITKLISEITLCESIWVVDSISKYMGVWLLESAKSY